MRRLFITAMIAGLLGGRACLAQVSTMGTTAMGIPSTPGTIVSLANSNDSAAVPNPTPGSAGLLP